MSGRGKSTKRSSDQTAAKMQAGEKKQCQRCRNDCGKDYMKCNLCDCIFHTKCESVSAQQLSLFRELDKLKTPYEWLCSSCRKTDVMNIMKSIQIMQTKIDNLEKEVASLKQKNTSDNSELSDASRSSHTVTPSATPISEAVNEAIDIERRKLNLVVSGMPQSGEKSDAELVHELLEDPALQITGTVFVRDVQRIGNKGLMLITFDSIENKRVVLKGAFHLRLSNIPGHRDIYISPDLTKKQRQIEFELRSELRLRRENGEVGLKISKGKIIQTQVPQGPRNVTSPNIVQTPTPSRSQNVSSPHVQTQTPQEPKNVSSPHVVRVQSGSSGAAPGNGDRGRDKSGTTQPHVVQVVRSGIPRRSTGSSGGGGGSAAAAGAAGSQGKN